MKLSFTSLQDFAKSDRAKTAVRQARAYDTPENRKKAKDLVSRLRNGKKRA